MSAEPEQKKRGRPKKIDSISAINLLENKLAGDDTGDSSVLSTDLTADNSRDINEYDDVANKRKRGRPPKKVAETSFEQDSPSTSMTDVALDQNDSYGTESFPKRKRGRPRKNPVDEDYGAADKKKQRKLIPCFVMKEGEKVNFSWKIRSNSVQDTPTGKPLLVAYRGRYAVGINDYLQFKSKIQRWKRIDKDDRCNLISEALCLATKLPCLNLPDCQFVSDDIQALDEHLQSCDKIPILKDNIDEERLAEQKAALNHYMSYKDRFEELRCMDHLELYRLLRSATDHQEGISCINCSKNYANAQGCAYHIAKCKAGDDVIEDEKVPKNMSPKDAMALYISYKGNFEGFRSDLSGKQKRRLINYLFDLQSPVQCIGCDKEITTSPGLYYHIDHCAAGDLDGFKSTPKKTRQRLLSKIFDYKSELPCIKCGQVIEGLSNMLSHLDLCIFQKTCPLCGEEVLHSAGLDAHICLLASSRKRKSAVAAADSFKSRDETGEESANEDNDNEIDDKYVQEESVSDSNDEEEDDNTGADVITDRNNISAKIITAKKDKGESSCYVPNAEQIKQRFVTSLSCCTSYESLPGVKDFSGWTSLNNNEFMGCDLSQWSESMLIKLDSDKPQQRLKPDVSTAFYLGQAVFCGCPVSACVWSPVLENGSQYIAVSTFNGPDNEYETGDAIIKLYSVAFSESGDLSGVKLCARIMHNYGTVLDLKWCPSPSPSGVIGLLAAATASGYILVYSIPILEKLDGYTQGATYRPKPLFTLKLSADTPDAVFCLDWNVWEGRFQLAATTANTGVAKLWNLLSPTDENALNGSVLLKDKGICSIAWLTENTAVINFADRTTGVINVDNLQWLYRELRKVSSTERLVSCPPLQRIFLYATDLPMNEGRSRSYLGAYDGVSVAHVRLANCDSSCILDCSLSPFVSKVAAVSSRGLLSLSDLSQNTRYLPNEKRVFVLEADRTDGKSTDFPDGPVSYEECCKDYYLKISQKKAPNNYQKEFIARELCGDFPVAAIHRVEWNLHKLRKRWLMCAGQAGILFLVKV